MKKKPTLIMHYKKGSITAARDALEAKIFIPRRAPFACIEYLLVFAVRESNSRVTHYTD